MISRPRAIGDAGLFFVCPLSTSVFCPCAQRPLPSPAPGATMSPEERRRRRSGRGKSRSSPPVDNPQTEDHGRRIRNECQDHGRFPGPRKGLGGRGVNGRRQGAARCRSRPHHELHHEQNLTPRETIMEALPSPVQSSPSVIRSSSTWASPAQASWSTSGTG